MAARKTQRLTRAERYSPAREFTLDPVVDAALAEHCAQAKETRSAVVNRALCRELGLLVPDDAPAPLPPRKK